MNEAPATTATPKLTAIQLIEQEIAGFTKQAEAAAKQVEQAIANTHAINGAVQASQYLLAKLKAEAVKAEAFVKADAEKADAEVVKGIHAVEAEANKIF